MLFAITFFAVLLKKLVDKIYCTSLLTECWHVPKIHMLKPSIGVAIFGNGASNEVIMS